MAVVWHCHLQNVFQSRAGNQPTEQDFSQQVFFSFNLGMV